MLILMTYNIIIVGPGVSFCETCKCAIGDGIIFESEKDVIGLRVAVFSSYSLLSSGRDCLSTTARASAAHDIN